MTIPAGTLVPRDARAFGSYELIAKIATGGMAEIYLARGPGADGHGRLVVKRILPHLAEDEHFVTMFRDEADLASRLVHPNVCRVFSLGHHDATWYIAMEYLHGVPLSRILSTLAKRKQLVDFRIIAAMIIQACDGLHHAHEARDDSGTLLGVVHRDVSPPNMMLIAGGTVKLLDFGIAKARGANSRTRTGTVKGKNAYMSPEQILGKPLDRRSDVFALGTVMYELLAVKRLFHRESDFLTFKAITEDAVPEIRERRPDIPPGLRAALLQALARDPSGRFATARGFAEAVRTGVSGLGGPATHAELSAFLTSEFGDELRGRDELLHAADAPAPLSLRTGATGSMSVMAPPVLAINAAVVDLESIGGELETAPDPGRSRRAATHSDAVPSMIVAGGTGPVGTYGLPTPSAPISSRIPQQRPSTSSGIAQMTPGAPPTFDAPAAMQFAMPESPSTDILGAYRRRNLRNTLLAAGVVIAIIVGIVVVSRRGTTPKAAETAVALPPMLDAPHAPDAHDVVDADTRTDIIAASKYGFFSLDANAPTEVLVDKNSIGTTPITKWPLRPGLHKVIVKGPRGKVQRFDVTIYAAQDTAHPLVTW